MQKHRPYWLMKMARYSFSGSIPAKFKHKLRRHKQPFGKTATTVVLCIGQIEASTSPPPLPGIPWAFDTFVVPGRREFDYQSLPGSGEFDPHAKGVGNLNRSLDFMWNVWALCTWRAIMAGTRCATNADCRLTDRQVNEVKIVVKFSNRFRIPKLDFPKTQSLVIGNLLKLSQQCLRRLPASMQVCSLRLTHTACPHVCLLIRCRYDARQWNSHKWHVWNVMISERFVCCMTNEEKLSLQCPCSSDFRRFAREFCSY